MLKITENYLPDDCDASTHAKLLPKAITVHWTGPYPGQVPADVRSWWARQGGEASAHFIIKDAECVQCWPLDRAAWHCGTRAGNYTSIGIEVIPKNIVGEFSEKSISTLKELIYYIFDKCGVLPIVRHYDWSKKDCPRFYTPYTEDGDKRWGMLLKGLKVNNS